MQLRRAPSRGSVLAIVGVSIPFLVYFTAPRFADEMRDPYTMTVRYGLNPFKIIAGNLRDVGPFLDVGNVRPLGRIAYSFEFVYSKGLADTLGVSLPFVHAVVRTSVLWAALAAIAGLWTALESSGRRSRPPLTRTVGLMACAAGVATLATWSHQPLVFFPAQGLLSATLVCAAAALTVRFAVSGGWRRGAACAVLGAICASFYDLAYVVVVVAPVALGGLRMLQGRTGEPRSSWSAGLPLLVGFGVVFVPIRVLIMRACAEQTCYQGSEIELTARALPTFAARVLSALPPTYWQMGLDSWTWWTVAIAPAVGMGVAAAALWAVRNRRDTTEEGDGLEVAESTKRYATRASALVVAAVAAAWMTAATMTALSVSLQNFGFDPHFPWRDGIYGFLFLAVLSWATIEWLSKARSPRTLAVALGVLAVMATVQFVLNTGTITYSRNLQPNPVYGRIDELFAANAGDDEVCELADDLYELVQQPESRYYSTALLESLKRLKPIEGCPAYQAPLVLDRWHLRQLGDLD